MTRRINLTSEQWGRDVLLPHRPHATNHLDRGQYRRSRDDALTMRYIEHSPHALLGSIVIDCDHPDAALRASRATSTIRRRTGWLQSFSGRAHLGWWLTSPVCRTDSARLDPAAFRAPRIEKGLCISVGGDSPTADNSPKTRSTPIGRRSTARPRRTSCGTWSPSTRPGRCRGGPTGPLVSAATSPCSTPPILGPTGSGGSTARHRRSLDPARAQRCHAINTEFADPLPFAEVRATAHSVGKWIWRNLDEVAYRADRARSAAKAAGWFHLRKSRPTGSEE